MTNSPQALWSSTVSQIRDISLIISNCVKSILHRIKIYRVVVIRALILLIGLPLLLLYVVPGIQNITLKENRIYISDPDSENYKATIAQKAILEKEVKRLRQKYSSLTGNQPYLVINTNKNSFVLFAGKRVSREGVCSTGSYVLLRNGADKQWLFETPKGMFRVQSKTTSPVWKKPDWAFVEEGLPVPDKDHNSRFEYGVLGDYALGLGDGYLIHGTLFQRFLGLPVTHGCVRMNDADLEMVYNTLVIGSKVYIY
jgi:L,D-transpeptidase YbiS